MAFMRKIWKKCRCFNFRDGFPRPSRSWISVTSPNSLRPREPTERWGPRYMTTLGNFKRASTFHVALHSMSLNLHKGDNFLRRTHTAGPNSVHLVAEILDCLVVAQLRSWPFSSVWVSFKGIFRVGLDRHHTRRRDRSETRHRELIGGNINARNRRSQSQALSPYLIFEY